MAYYTQPIGRIPSFFGGGALLISLFLTIGTVIAVWWRADISASLSAADWAAVRFTIFQAIVSAILSIVIAIPTARALARQKFFGKHTVILLMGAPFILPTIVAILGLLAVWGRNGYISNIVELWGFNPLNIYGIMGVILAHVFFNVPFATRFYLQGWATIPQEHFRLSAQLGLSERNIFRHLERPMLYAITPTIFLQIFLLCITSFAIVLAMGGGPKATSLELAIYQALRFDFNLSKAAQLAMIQLAICIIIATLALCLTQPMVTQRTIALDNQRWDGQSWPYKLCDSAIIISVCCFLLLPLISVFYRGVFHLFDLKINLWQPVLYSMTIAIFSVFITITMALSISVLIVRLSHKSNISAYIAEIISFLSLTTSPFVMGTGLFIIVYPYISPFAMAWPLTAIVNTAMALPFCIRAILPALRKTESNFGRLADTLGLKGWARFRIAIWPALRPVTGFSAGLTAALSMGNLGVITLFAPPDIATLPLVMYRLMASYQMTSAAAVAVILLCISMGLFWIFDKGGRHKNYL